MYACIISTARKWQSKSNLLISFAFLNFLASHHSVRVRSPMEFNPCSPRSHWMQQFTETKTEHTFAPPRQHVVACVEASNSSHPSWPGATSPLPSPFLYSLASAMFCCKMIQKAKLNKLWKWNRRIRKSHIRLWRMEGCEGNRTRSSRWKPNFQRERGCVVADTWGIICLSTSFCLVLPVPGEKGVSYHEFADPPALPCFLASLTLTPCQWTQTHIPAEGREPPLLPYV